MHGMRAQALFQGLQSGYTMIRFIYAVLGSILVGDIVNMLQPDRADNLANVAGVAAFCILRAVGGFKTE